MKFTITYNGITEEFEGTHSEMSNRVFQIKDENEDVEMISVESYWDPDDEENWWEVGL